MEVQRPKPPGWPKFLIVRHNLMIMSPKAIDEVLEQHSKNGLVLKVVDGLWDYFCCEVKFSQNKKRAWLGQLYLFESLEKMLW